ncbi:hypothetical protein EV05_1753 [Prochlorococcus sp. MIT 0601]|nr:hypothetical protein EV05_1753 [Prochlorococcus sp. MIT 0601]
MTFLLIIQKDFFIKINLLFIESNNISIASLTPLIIKFIWVVAFLGPVSIAIIIYILKQIEKENPERVRWR